jgi:hypothetical protein
MKTGKSLVELATEIQRQAAAKVDYVADTRKLMVTPTPAALHPNDSTAAGGMWLNIQNGDSKVVGINSLAHRQIAERVGIPAKYYDRMMNESPTLLATNVNHWFQQSPETRMIRTLDGRARAFLSNRYQRIDNHHVAEVVLPVLSETPGIEIMSTEITDARLYIKAVTHRVQAEVKSRRVGDLVEAGVMISNSEVGLGAISVQPFFHFLVCLNGMVRNKDGLRAAHVGTRLDADEALATILADDTRKVLDRGVLLKVRDVVRAAMDEARFKDAVAAMQEQTNQVVQGDPAKAIEVLADDFGMLDSERASVLRHLIEGGDLSRYGLMNAVTRTAEDLPNYDRATEFETMGGRILDLPRNQWERYAKAA